MFTIEVQSLLLLLLWLFVSFVVLQVQFWHFIDSYVVVSVVDCFVQSLIGVQQVVRRVDWIDAVISNVEFVVVVFDSVVIVL